MSPDPVADAVDRTGAQLLGIRQDRLPPAEQRAAELQAEVTRFTESGRPDHAARMGLQLGELLDGLGDAEGAESAYRRAVALARQADATDPEAFLAAFAALSTFLTPSEESVALAHEAAQNLLNRDEMYHPMRAAEATHLLAVAELTAAEHAPDRVDHIIDGIVRPAMATADDACLHGIAQDLQRQVAALLHKLGRLDDAARWQAEADRYEPWEFFSEQEIPGHVHLWDIRMQPTVDGEWEEAPTR